MARLASSIRQDLTQECETLATVVTIGVAVLEPLTEVPAVQLAVAEL
jgi:hypothetical protein